MPKPLDQMWEYGEPCGDANRTKLSCKLCGMEMLSKNCLKYHFAKISRHDVDICHIAIPDIVLIAKNSILDTARKRD